MQIRIQLYGQKSSEMNKSCIKNQLRYVMVLLKNEVISLIEIQREIFILYELKQLETIIILLEMWDLLLRLL
ncbi:hypothetical protein EM4838_01645 [Enterococcus mundtii]|uniref:Uncharacterized protein n=1 Tax=Enterococcus mundtii TaxID=53346 RepID=A0ABQ0VGB2_ENTMU|nr:hypothetical protein EM4838_01645 [Enterococcus mundtii]GEL81714.1 hypothetical protein EMU01_28580 [Enterococcus mundtii]GEN20374.1 hypothetical protein LAC02_36550 [Ligilactobacillus acidipiscis]